MKINFQYVIAIVLFALIALWFLINMGKDNQPMIARADNAAVVAPEISRVEVRQVSAQSHPTVYSLYGRTEAVREVQLKAETPGIVVSTPATEGRRVRAGQLVCRQDIDARQANLDQARANLRSMETDLNAARTLAAKGFQSSTRVTQLEAQLDGAKAAVKSAEIELANVNIRTPFSGIWERQMAEVGDYLSPGMPCGLLVDLSPLLVVVQLSESQLSEIDLGTPADVQLATGQNVSGEVALIEAKADPATRTFRTEIRIANDDLALKAGVTATVKLRAGETLATRVPANIVTLDDSGSVGVRYLDGSDIVRFARTTTIDEDSGGIWVTGLPDRTRIIVQGQDFVAVGAKVEPVMAGSTGAGR